MNPQQHSTISHCFRDLTIFLYLLTQQVKSVLDPCEDENNDNPDDEVSLGTGSTQKVEATESDNEVTN